MRLAERFDATVTAVTVGGEDADEVLRRALAKLPDDRYPSCRELEAALAPYRDGPNADPVIVALIEAERGFKVVAMDTLRGYLEAHPEESAVRPLLAQIYAELGLADLQAAEAERVRHGH